MYSQRLMTTSRVRFRHHLTCQGLLVASLSAPVFAQSVASGSMAGTVKDDSGAVRGFVAFLKRDVSEDFNA